MSTATSHGGLTQAFRSFERVAIDLEERHARLQGDVTRLESRLRDSNRRLETVLDALDHGVGVVDRRGRIVRANPALRRLATFDRHDRPHDETLRRLLAGRTPASSTCRLTLDSVTGDRECAVTLVPTGDEVGTRVLTVHDITEIRREDEEGGRRRRLEALGRMAAELAHEVRNPLGSIRLWASLLRDDADDDAGTERPAMVDQILSAVAGLERTVSNLLSFAVPPRGTRASFDLASAAADACALIAPVCSVRGVTIEGPGPSPCLIGGDVESLRQVVLNLVGNALAATDTGGRIAVAVEPREPDGVRLRVHDDGRGIEPDDLPRVFDPFFSRTDGGTGLGLSIAQRAVERHGGRIAIDSRPGRGTTVTVDLPRAGTEEE